MTRSMAGFHLGSGLPVPRPQTSGAALPSYGGGGGGENAMQRSVDRLFSEAHHSEPVTRLSGNALANATILEEQSTEASLSPKTSEHELAGRVSISSQVSTLWLSGKRIRRGWEEGKHAVVGKKGVRRG